MFCGVRNTTYRHRIYRNAPQKQKSPCFTRTFGQFLTIKKKTVGQYDCINLLFLIWLRRQDLNLLGLWYPKLPLCRTATRNFDHCPFDISLFPSPTALDIKASYSPFGLITLRSQRKNLPRDQSKKDTKRCPLLWQVAPI